MNCERLMYTAGSFLGGAFCIARGINDIKIHSAITQEPPIALLKTSSILFPLTVLIGIATEKVFEEMGWRPGSNRDLATIFFPVISATALTSVVAVKCGFTASLSTGLAATAIAGSIVLGLSWIITGLGYIYQGEAG